MKYIKIIKNGSKKMFLNLRVNLTWLLNLHLSRHKNRHLIRWLDIGR